MRPAWQPCAMPAMRSIFAVAPAPDNRRFANAALAFVNRARVPLAAARWLGAAATAAAVVMTIAGAFGTGAMPIGLRAGFWSLLMGWSAIKWLGWFVLTVRRSADWWRAALAGAFLLNLPLPLEIDAALAALGVSNSGVAASIWLEALALSAVSLAIIALIRRNAAQEPQPVVTAAPPPTFRVAPDGLLSRARISIPSRVIAIMAEDHYCRVHEAGNADSLIHYRFGDAVAEVSALDGLRVHRGAWVAAAAVVGARRERRRWRLVLRTGAEIPVSAPHLAAVRARGWLRPTRPAADEG